MKVTATTKSTLTADPRMIAFDSEFWGLPIARAEGFTDEISQWAKDNTVGLMCLLIDTDRPDEIQAAEERGYRTTDVRVTLARKTAPFASSARMVKDEEVDAIAQIARSAHRITRFYADPSLDSDRCDDLYESWVRQSCAGWADRVLVVGPPDGYITIHLDGTSSSIGLIAVDDMSRRSGKGYELVTSAIDFAHAHEATDMTVVTQGRNVNAQRLFQSCGFRTTKTEVWLHKRFQ